MCLPALIVGEYPAEATDEQPDGGKRVTADAGERMGGAYKREVLADLGAKGRFTR